MNYKIIRAAVKQQKLSVFFKVVETLNECFLNFKEHAEV